MATLVACCGAECGNGAVDPGHLFPISNASFSTGTVRSGARSLRVNPTGAGGYALVTIPGSEQHLVLRAYVRFASLPSGNALVLGTVSGVGRGIWFDSSESKLYCGSASETYGATGVSVTTGVWYLLDLYINSSANPWTIDAKVDGTSLGQATVAIGAQNIATGVCGQAATWTGDSYYDDYAASRTAGDYPIGAGYVNHFIPTADGTHNIAGTADFRRGDTGVDILNATTTAYQLIDDEPIPTSVDEADCVRRVATPNATDYVECVFGNGTGVSTPTTAPRLVSAIAMYHSVSGTTNNVRCALNDNGSITDIMSLSSSGTSAQYRSLTLSDPPSAASAWTVAGDGSNGDFLDLRCRIYSSDANPDTMVDSVFIEAEFEEAATGYTLTPTVGTATFTGASVTLTRDKLLTPTVAARSFTGASVTLKKVLRLTAVAAAVVITGQSVTLTRDKLLTPTVGAAAFTGQSVTITRDKLLTPSVGAATFTGQSVTLTKVLRLTPTVGSATFTGQSVTLTRDRLTTPTVGAANFTGQSVTFTRAKLLTPTVGTGTFTGHDVTLTHEVQTTFTLTPTVGTANFTGQIVTLTKDRLITPSVASTAFTGQSVTVTKDRLISPTVGAGTFTGASVTVTRDKLITPALGAGTFTGYSVVLTHEEAGSFTLTPTVGTATFTGQAVTLTRDKLLSPSVGSAAFTGQSVTISRDKLLSPTVGAATFTGQSVTLTRDKLLTPTVGAAVFTGHDVELSWQPSGYLLTPTVGAANFTGHSVRILYGVHPLSEPLTVALNTGNKYISLRTGEMAATLNTGELTAGLNTGQQTVELNTGEQSTEL